MVSKEKLERINYLAKKSKGQGLTESERSEQAELRQEYLKSFREGFRSRLENIEIVEK